MSKRSRSGSGENGMAYLDLLASTLTEHEKTLDTLIEKLEKVSENLTSLVQRRRPPGKGETKPGAVQEEAPETIIYMKIRYGRSVEELTKILETLTEK